MVNPSANYKQSCQCLNGISRLRKNAHLPCVDLQIVVCGGVQEVEGVHSGSIMKPRPSRVLQHSKPPHFIG